MARRRYIDPQTGDYVRENGAVRLDATRVSEVVLRMRTRRGTGIYPNFGSRLHTITANVPGATRLAEHYALECVDDLVASGAIRDVVPTATVETVNGTAMLAIELEFRDTDNEERVARYTLAFGG